MIIQQPGEHVDKGLELAVRTSRRARIHLIAAESGMLPLQGMAL